jgi:predicted Fe-S protein YdhL (DUF1289 family)
MNPRDTPTGSPCRGVCTATALGDPVCKGCGRTQEEVDNWNTYSDEQKIAIKERLRKEKNHEEAN